MTITSLNIFYCISLKCMHKVCFDWVESVACPVIGHIDVALIVYTSVILIAYPSLLQKLLREELESQKVKVANLEKQLTGRVGEYVHDTKVFI